MSTGFKVMFRLYLHLWKDPRYCEDWVLFMSMLLKSLHWDDIMFLFCVWSMESTNGGYALGTTRQEYMHA